MQKLEISKSRKFNAIYILYFFKWEQRNYREGGIPPHPMVKRVKKG